MTRGGVPLQIDASEERTTNTTVVATHLPVTRDTATATAIDFDTKGVEIGTLLNVSLKE